MEPSSPLRKPLAEHPCHSRLPPATPPLPPASRPPNGPWILASRNSDERSARSFKRSNRSSLEGSLLDWMAAAAGRAGRPAGTNCNVRSHYVPRSSHCNLLCSKVLCRYCASLCTYTTTTRFPNVCPGIMCCVIYVRNCLEGTVHPTRELQLVTKCAVRFTANGNVRQRARRNRSPARCCCSPHPFHAAHCSTIPWPALLIPSNAGQCAPVSTQAFLCTGTLPRSTQVKSSASLSCTKNFNAVLCNHLTYKDDIYVSINNQGTTLRDLK